MKKMKIPTSFGYPTMKVTVNGQDYHLQTGKTIWVSADIAPTVEQAIKANEPKMKPPQASFGGRVIRLNADGTHDTADGEILSALENGLRVCCIRQVPDEYIHEIYTVTHYFKRPINAGMAFAIICSMFCYADNKWKSITLMPNSKWKLSSTDFAPAYPSGFPISEDDVSNEFVCDYPDEFMIEGEEP